MEFSHQLFLVALLLPLVSCAGPIYEICSQPYSNNNLLLNNINRVNIEFVTITPSNGYATSTISDGGNTVYGLSRCRADIGFQACSECIVAAYKKLQALCPNTAASRIWYDFCFIRHGTINFFGSLDVSDTHVLIGGKKIADSQEFNPALGKLLTWVKMSAFSDSRMFGMGETRTVNGKITIYGMAQCTRDLQVFKCLQCLEIMTNWLNTYCKDQIGCIAESSSCVLRYGTYKFLMAPEIPLVK